MDLLGQDIIAVGDELVPGLKEAEELDSSVPFPLDDRVVLNHHCVRIHSLKMAIR